MIDLEILRECGSTNARLKEVFTAKPPGPKDKLTAQERKAREKLLKKREEWETRISNRLNENMEFALKNHAIYSAVDLAWNAPPISKEIYPLMLYAQGKIDTRSCASMLDTLCCSKDFVTQDAEGNKSIDLPKFVQVSFNLVRSVLTRRLAAQVGKYNNLWPYLKYESRSTSEVGKLRADVMSQIADITADAYGWRAHDEEVCRDMMMYAHCVDFVRSAWESEKTWSRKPMPPGIVSSKIEYEDTIAKEGLIFHNPHPTRVFWDNAHPMKSLNTDSGCSYVGYWDVVRAGDILNDPKWWNRSGLGWTNSQVTMFSLYANYFSQYYCTVKPPRGPEKVINDLNSDNERLTQVGRYAGEFDDTGMVIANYFEKLIPKEHGFGNYPYPTWVRFITAGWNTVICAEFMPSSPAAVASYNENSAFQVNPSLAHELLSYQDQMTNLLNYLLLSLRADNHKVLVIDTDAMEPEHVKQLRAQAKGASWYNKVIVLEVSRSKMADMGMDVDKVIRLVETKSGAAIDLIFQAMLRLMQLMERMIAMSPQEMGQPAPREISATETNSISGTTESVFGHISDGMDEFRSAKKRIFHESYLNMGRTNFRVPVTNRYPKATILAAGLEPFDEDSDIPNLSGVPKAFTVLGTKDKLRTELIFTSRDGSERASNLNSAQYLSELLKSILPIPAVQQAMTKGKFYEVINELFRMTGAYDIKLEAPPGEEDEPLAGQTDAQVIEQLVQIVEQNQKDVQAIAAQLNSLMQSLQQPQPQPQIQAA